MWCVVVEEIDVERGGRTGGGRTLARGGVCCWLCALTRIDQEGAAWFGWPSISLPPAYTHIHIHTHLFCSSCFSHAPAFERARTHMHAITCKQSTDAIFAAPCFSHTRAHPL